MHSFIPSAVQLAADAFAQAQRAAEAARPAERARQLARYRVRDIERLAGAGTPLAHAAIALRRRARGPSKLGRRLRRKFELGRAGAH